MLKIQLDTAKVGDAVKYWENKTSVETAVIEEIGELLIAISKYERHIEDESYFDNLKEEIRDNFIGLSMLMYKHGICVSEMNSLIDEKLNATK